VPERRRLQVIGADRTLIDDSRASTFTVCSTAAGFSVTAMSRTVLTTTLTSALAGANPSAVTNT